MKTHDIDQQQKIGSTPDLRKWRTELPNMLDDSNLTPFEFRLLVHYYRRGNCWEGVRSTAKACNMSIGMVVKAREGLNDKGWIIIKGQTDFGTLDITPVNKWQENFQMYSKCSCGEQGCSCGEQGCSCGELKNQPIKNDDDDEGLTHRTKTLATLYEENIGAITPLMADILRNATIDYPIETWYQPAFAIAVKNNARSWNYVDAILDSWKRNGFGWKPERKNGRKNGKSREPEPKRLSTEEIDRLCELAKEQMVPNANV